MIEKGRGCFGWAARFALAFCLVVGQAIEITAQSAPAQPEYVEVEKNQLIEMRLETFVSSATAKEGDPIAFRLTEPLVAGGKTVLPAGFVVTARVTKAEKAGSSCKPGELEWKLEDPKAPDGTTIPLRSTFANRLYGTGKLVEPEPPRTFGEKMKIALLAPVIAVGFILIAPIYVAFTAMEREEKCYENGRDKSHGPGYLAHAAVRKHLRVALPAEADNADAGETREPAQAPEFLPVRVRP